MDVVSDMQNFQLDESVTEICPETRLNLCKFLQAAPIKNMLLKDGRCVTDPGVWNEFSKEIIIPAIPENKGRALSLLQACLKGDEETVKSILSSGECNVNEVSVDGETTLSCAVAKNSIPIVELLLQRGADPNLKEKKADLLPLIKASQAGYTEIVKLLLQHGASVALTSNTGYTALHFAATNGHLDCVRLLLQYRSPLEVQNENGHTPLMEATSNGHIEVAGCLIEHGADINTHSTEFKESALTLASYKGHAEMVKFLLDAGACHEHRTDEMHTALMEAAMEGHVEVAKLLLAHGANVNIPHDSFESPLTLAACGGHTELVHLLLGYEADIEEVNDEGYTPLMEAAREGHEETVALLLAAGADVNAKTEETQETALTLAACGGFIEVCEMLLNANADIEVGGGGCSTPLMEAAQEGHYELVRRLLQQGANVNAITGTGDTALHYAAENGHVKVCKELLNWCSGNAVCVDGCKTPLMKAARAGHLEVVELFVEWQMPINYATTQNDATALSLACTGGHVNVVEYLLKHGADPHHQLRDNNTMLIEAARSGNAAVMRLILDYPKGLSQPTVAPALQSPQQSSVQPQHSQQQQQQQQQPSSRQPLQQMQNGPGAVNIMPPPLPMGAPVLESLTLNPLYGHHQASTAATVRQALNAQQTPSRLNAALANAYAAGWADGAAACTQQPQQSVAAAAGVLQSPIYSSDSHATSLGQKTSQKHGTGGDFVSQSVPSKSMDPTVAAENVSAVVEQMASGDVSAMSFAYSDELGSGLMALFQELMPNSQDDKAALLRRIEAMICPLNAVRGATIGCEQSQQLQAQLQPSVDAALHNLVKQQRSAQQIGGGDSSTFIEFPPGSNNLFSAPTGLNQWDLFPDMPNVNCASQQGQQSVAQNQVNNEVGPEKPGSSSSSSLTAGCSSSSSSSSSSAFSISTQLIDTSAPYYSNYAKPVPPLFRDSQGAAVLSEAYKVASTVTCPLDGAHSQKIVSPAIQQPNTMQQVSITSVHASTTTSTSFTMADCNALNLLNLSNAAGDIPPAFYGQLLGQFPQQCISPAASSASALSDLPASPTLFTARGGGTTATTTTLTTVASAAAGTGIPNPAVSVVPPCPPPTMFPATSVETITPVDINACTESGMESALTLACNGGFVDLVRLLLERGADKEHRDKKSHTPLHTAVYANQRHIVSLLLDYGADIEAQIERTKDTALSIACSHGRLEIAEELLNRGANKEHRNFSDYTPLSLAASGGFVDVIQLLLRHGAEINSRTGSKLGISPLMLASMNGFTNAVRVLLEHGSDINAQIETNRNTALTLACFQGQHEVVELLVDRKANIEHRAKTGLTPLMEAASGNHVKVGTILLERGADVNALPVLSSRDTALTIASDKGRTEFVRLLLKQGATVEARNKKGATSLWLACNGGHLEVVQSLIDAHADVNSQDNRKVSCLMAAFRKSHVGVVSLLVHHVTQFPSDKDCLRHIKTISAEKELAERCQQCRKIISAAKEKQESEARKNADFLLEQIEQEEEEKANKEAMQARKRERKKNKRKAKAEKEKEVEEENEEITIPAEKPVPAKPLPPLLAKKETPLRATNEPVLEPNEVNQKKESDSKRSRKETKQITVEFVPVKEPSPNPPSTASITEAKREKHRSKKQNQRATKRSEIKSVDTPITTASLSVFSSASTVSNGIEKAATSVPPPLTTQSSLYDPRSFPDDSDAFWEPALETTSESNSWLVVQPTGGSRKATTNVSYTTAAVTQESTDWKTTSSSGGGNMSKRKLAISVSKHDIGKIIGQGGAVVSALRNMSGIQIDIESARGEEVTERMVYLKGPSEIVQKTYNMIQGLLSGAIAGNDVIAKHATSKKLSQIAPATVTTAAKSSSKLPTNVSTKKASISTASTLQGLLLNSPKAIPMLSTQPLLSAKPMNLMPTHVSAKTGPNTNNNNTNINASSLLTGAKANSWGVKSAGANVQKGNFAAVAAAGVVTLATSLSAPQPKEAKTKTKLAALTTATSASKTFVSVPTSLLSATVSSLIADTAPSLTSNVHLDDQSFPPLSTVATSRMGASVDSRGQEHYDDKYLSSPDFADVSPVLASPPVSCSAEDDLEPTKLLDSDKTVSKPSAPLLNPVVTPSTAVSRPFARAPGSERSAFRQATTTIHTPVSCLADPGGVVVTPTKRADQSSFNAAWQSAGAGDGESLSKEVEHSFFSQPSSEQVTEVPFSSSSCISGSGPSIPTSSKGGSEDTQIRYPSNFDSLFTQPQAQQQAAKNNFLWLSGQQPQSTELGFAQPTSFPYEFPASSESHLPKNLYAHPSTNSTGQQFVMQQQNSVLRCYDGAPTSQEDRLPAHLYSSYRLMQTAKHNGVQQQPVIGSRSTTLASSFPQQQPLGQDYNSVLFNGESSSSFHSNISPPLQQQHAMHQQRQMPPQLAQIVPPQQQQPQIGMQQPHKQQFIHQQFSGLGGLPNMQQPEPTSYMGPSYPILQSGHTSQPPAPIGAERRRQTVSGAGGSVVVSGSNTTAPTQQAPTFGATPPTSSGSAAAAAMAASSNVLMAFTMNLMQQTQQLQQQEHGNGPVRNWPMHQHPSFWSQGVGGGLSNQNGTSQQHQQSLMANMAALANLCPSWPPAHQSNQPQTSSGGVNGNWMMPPPPPPPTTQQFAPVRQVSASSNGGANCSLISAAATSQATNGSNLDEQ